MYLYPFQRHFRLDLIPASHADISLCDLVWKRKNKSPLLGRKGMPNNLYNLFLAEDFITDTQWREAITSFESEKLISAQLGNLEVKANRRFGSSFQHPVVQYFHSESHFSNNLQFYFTDIRVRVLSNSWRIKIQTHLEKFNKKLEKKIFKRYRSIFLITELYYGNIRIQIDRSQIHRANSFLLSTSTNQPTLKYENDRDYVYEFSNMEVPFAMRLESVKEFRS